MEILLPYWGEFKLLQQAVESVLLQTNHTWKMIVIDDCYPSDEAEKYITSLHNDRITYCRNKTNLGLVKNYNYALSLSTADYCVIMGCDDIMLPRYIETALAGIGDADYYQPNVQVIDEMDSVYLPMADRVKRIIRPKRSGIHSGESIATSLCCGNWTYFPSILWKGSTIRKYKFDEKYPNTQDLLIQLNILCDGGSISIDDTTTFQYRRSASSFSSKAKNGTRFQEEDAVYNELAKRFRNMGWKKAYLAARLHFTVRLHRILS